MARSRKRSPEQYRREYLRRLERGRERGLTREQALGHRKRVKQRKTVQLPDAGLIVRPTAAEATRRRALRMAQSEGRLVGCLCVVDSDGQHTAPGPHQRWFDGQSYKYPLTGDVVSVQLVIPARGMAGVVLTGGGVPAGDILDLLDSGGAGELDDWNVVLDDARDEGLF